MAPFQMLRGGTPGSYPGWERLQSGEPTEAKPTPEAEQMLVRFATRDAGNKERATGAGQAGAFAVRSRQHIREGIMILRFVLPAFAAAALVMAVAGSAGAEKGTAACQLAGTASLTPGLKVKPATVRYTFSGR